MTDPRALPGAITGPGGSHDRAGVVIDTRRAVLLDYCTVSTVDDWAGGPAYALLLSGRINRSQDRADVLFLFGTDGVAAIVTELMGLLGRATGRDDAAMILADIAERMAQLRADGNLS